jgi:cystathionine gamma-synthase/cystathionine gamma-lyase
LYFHLEEIMTTSVQTPAHCSSQETTQVQRQLGFATQAIIAGQEPDPSTGAIATPIFQTSTFVQQGLGKNKGYQYARSHNPTRTALEQCLATLEQGKYGLALGSGMAAAATVLQLLSSGDHVVVGEDVYGGVYRLFEKVLRRYGISFTYVNARDLKQVEAAFKKETKLLWVESPTNPLVWLSDIQALSKLARARNIITVVDNTFASPYFQKPLTLGADIVVHSATKYLAGHCDVIGGGIVTSNDELYETLKFHQNAVGGVPGPFDCYLVLRGIKTLALRMKQHEKNALAIARLLEKHSGVEKVYYPGLTSHPQHTLAATQMNGFGGIVSFVIKDGINGVEKFLEGSKLFALAESLGGVKSLVAHPASMTHAPVPPDVRAQRGIVDGLIRLSVGIEDTEDLLDDIATALSPWTISKSA